MAKGRPSPSPFPASNLKGKIMDTLKVHPFRRRIVHERGTTNRGCLLGILLIIIVAYVGYKFGPVFLDDYQLRTTAIQIADYAAAGVLSETKYGTGRGLGEIEQIREAVLVEAIDLQLPLIRDNITAEKEAGFVFITIRYVVPISLPWGEMNWNFEYTVSN